MLSLPYRLLLLCVLAGAASEGEKLWTLEATVVHSDPSDPSDPVTSTVEDSIHANMETLATLELTLHDLHLHEGVVNSPGRFAVVSLLSYSLTHNIIL